MINWLRTRVAPAKPYDHDAAMAMMDRHQDACDRLRPLVLDISHRAQEAQMAGAPHSCLRVTLSSTYKDDVKEVTGGLDMLLGQSLSWVDHDCDGKGWRIKENWQ